MLPVGNKKIELSVQIPRIYCKICFAVKQVKLAFADPKKHYTRSLERFVIDLCRITTLSNVADLTGLSWDTIKDIHKLHLYKKYRCRNLKKLKYLAIDELYLGKKQKFITIVLDLETGQVVHIGKGKGKDALNGLWSLLRRSKANIKAVATDMASGFMAAVLEKLPEADLVLDHFHLVKWFNEKLSLLRRQLYHQANKMGKQTLKGSRWLLLKASENLKEHSDHNKDERFRLQRALELNVPLATAYYMKERFRLMFQLYDQGQAKEELDQWAAEARASGIKILIDAAKKLVVWKPFILNWHKHQISTSKLEATNSKIGTLQRNAYGYRDEQYLKLRIYNIHNSNYALTG
jgi:transposase